MKRVVVIAALIVLVATVESWAAAEGESSPDGQAYDAMAYVKTADIPMSYLNAAVEARYGDAPSVRNFWAAVCGITTYLLEDEGFIAFVENEIESPNSLDRWRDHAEQAGLTVRDASGVSDMKIIVIESDVEFERLVEAEMAEARRYGASEAAAALIHDVLWNSRGRFPDGVPIPPEIDMWKLSLLRERACDLEQMAQQAAFRRGILTGIVTLVGASTVILDVAGTVPTGGIAIGSVALGSSTFAAGLNTLIQLTGGDG